MIVPIAVMYTAWRQLRTVRYLPLLALIPDQWAQGWTCRTCLTKELLKCEQHRWGCATHGKKQPFTARNSAYGVFSSSVGIARILSRTIDNSAS